MGAKIIIVTDSTADISPEIREELGIVLVPLKVHFGQDVYLDSVTIESDEFFEKLAASHQLPTTSQPSPADFMEIYERLLEENPGAHIISLHLSSALSGTYQSAILARSLMDREDEITILDSKSASNGFGLPVIAAARMASEGAAKEEILAEITRLLDDIRFYFLVDTLEYLQKGGRIGKAAALFGSILNIKPILTVDREGTVAPVDKVRGQRKAMVRIMELLKQDFDGVPVNISMAWAYHQGNAMELYELAKAHFDVRQVSYATLGAVIGTHVGPGTSAIFMTRA
ncbi:DegV family protein [Paenibacillus sp. GCM10012307]|uniref:DegV family protein n=1 Tax=Paenibacillus roseus TaxID=2798579 RepID=A0A934J1Z4_9BACL|nr:DegV family protein [Paenibacillus roseus]MBJ6363317.1 DegV family protein [Paenibacillus roseus]